MTSDEFHFDLDPSEFPEVWNSDEVDISVKVDAIVNKHVYLAFQEYSENCRPMFQIDENGLPILYDSMDDGGRFPLSWDIEPLVMDLGPNMYDDECLQKAAESFRRCASHLESLVSVKP